MIKTTIGFLIGCLSILSLSHLPEIDWSALCVIVLIITLFLRKWAFASFIFGALWTGFNATAILDNQLAVTPSHNLLIQGQIIGLPVLENDHLVFEFSPTNTPIKLPQRIRLSWYYPPATRPKAGEKWQLQVKLKPPHGLMNPGGFDYEGWLFLHQIGATGYVRNTPENRRLSAAKLYSVDAWRQFLIQQLQLALPHSVNRGLIEGLTVGERADITTEQWQLMRQTGTSHLMAISGLHIGLAAALGLLLIKWLWSRSSRLLHIFPARQAGAVGGLIFALFYALLAGLSIPTQRALIMVSMAMLALLMRRSHYLAQLIALSLLLVLLNNPFAILSPGLWLSYTAVSLLFIISRQRGSKHFWRWIKNHFLLALGLSPLLLLFFNQVSVIAPLANMIAIPVVSLVTVPLLLFAVIMMPVSHSLFVLLLKLTDQSLSLLWHILNAMASWPISNIYTSTIPITLLILLIIGTVLVILPRGVPGRWLGLVAAFPIFLSHPARPQSGELWFTLLDVGQGLAAVVQTHSHCLVFDTGPAYGSGFNAGSAVIEPFLQAKGIKHINTLIVSHGDNDHSGGAKAVIEAADPDLILSSVPDRFRNGKPCSSGQKWQWDGVQFNILSPGRSATGSDNNLSCVLRVSNQQGSVLLTGDIEYEAEQLMLKRYDRQQLQSTILVAPHHGSRTSSSILFIDTIDPEFVLFPVGYHNRYHFPAGTVLQRYKQHGVTTLQTASQGAISFKIGPTRQLTPTSWRQKNAKLWTANATE